MEFLPINDLPNEVLEMIFDHCNVEDLTNASLVCRRWSDLAFTGRRMDRVRLVPIFPWNKDLLQSNRKYRHLGFAEIRKSSAHVKELFQAFSVTSLRIKDVYTCAFILYSSLRVILLEVPNLQHLWIANEPFQLNKMIEPLPVMRKLERLEIEYNHNNHLESTPPWHTIAPSLQSLKMCCRKDEQLEQWRLFSGQLKHVYVTQLPGKVDSFTRFCEMTFPLLHELSIVKSSFAWEGYSPSFVQRHSLLTRYEFFRRNSSLRRLCLDGIELSKTLLQDITSFNKKLTSLEIIGLDNEYERNDEPGSLESLSQLPELKHLRLKNLNTSILRGCFALTSLQSLCIDGTQFAHEITLGFVEDLFKIAPQLRCLELGSLKMSEKAAHFICNNFLNLTRLRLTYSEEVSRDCLSEIDRLPHLWYLELDLIDTHRLFTSIIPQNKVRCLTLHLRDHQYDENDLLRLSEIFSQLDRLNLINWCYMNLYQSTIDRLRKLLPTCAINICGCLVTNTGRKIIRKWSRSEIMPVWEKEWIFKNRI